MGQVPCAGWSDIPLVVPAVRLIAAELIHEYEGVICLLQKTLPISWQFKVCSEPQME